MPGKAAGTITLPSCSRVRLCGSGVASERREKRRQHIGARRLTIPAAHVAEVKVLETSHGREGLDFGPKTVALVDTDGRELWEELTKTRQLFVLPNTGAVAVLILTHHQSAQQWDRRTAPCNTHGVRDVREV
eukprot:scaffold10114_cov67-Phaeocystis_antarctica.AAC.6